MTGLGLATKGMLTRVKKIYVGGGAGLHKYDDDEFVRKPEIHVTKFGMNEPDIVVTEDMIQVKSVKMILD
ncbi:hypothetical protein KAR91_66325 [Candidatus Pacearchaeota archaeon]|nr:hypothetical protein [Candidatus Pacearchaeota archaeon]